ncbi:adenosine receptor A2b-like [Penaeus japonicus]|uniref:adenosine receptor A2b-like n=1 Tax=Penaeus japonicus TaxID=27405 RepID=UPI001C70E9CF|nr:adenosine receptor A2b-like [Penaeus japonicus]
MSVEITDPHWPNLTSTLETVASELTAEPEGDPPLDLTYAITEILVAVVAIIGNALTLTVFAVDRKLRRLTNYYIVALAVADLLVGVLGIPFAILTSIGLPKLLWPCLLMLSTLLVLCTTSIFCLVAVSVDRYWAILYPLRYSRVMTAKIARYIILMCWLAGTFIGLLPLMGWHGTYEGHCTFTVVMDYDYLVFLYFFTIVGPGIIMAVFYTHIYTVVLKQVPFYLEKEKESFVCLCVSALLCACVLCEHFR